MAELAAHDAEEGEVASDEEYSDESEREEEDVGEDTAAAADLPEMEKLRIGDSAVERASDAAPEDGAEEEEDEEEADDDDDSEEGSEEEDGSDLGEEAEEEAAARTPPPRLARRPARTGARDVESIVSASLSRTKAQQDRRHHGKKPVSANVLGRQKGSKKKQNASAREARTASKQGGGRGGDFW